jgi:hypothetical protein
MGNSDVDKDTVGYLLLAMAMLCFLVLKSYSLAPVVSDENIYFYDAWLISKGFLPYRDFFFAHPPLHLFTGVPLALLDRELFLPAIKFLPSLFTGVTGLSVFLITRRATGIFGAIAAAMLFLFSYDVLRSSSHWTGANQAVFWVVLAMQSVLRGRDRLAGVLSGIGVCTAIYTLPSAAVLGLLLIAAGGRRAVSYFAAFGLVLILVNGVFYLVGGDGFLDGVYRYHLLKSGTEGSGLAGQLNVLLFHNFFILVAPLLMLPILVLAIRPAGQDEEEPLPRFRFLHPEEDSVMAIGIWCLLIWAVNLVFLAGLAKVYHYYIMILMPFAAVCGGIFADRAVKAWRDFFREKSKRGGWSILLAIVMVAIGIFVYPQFEKKLSYFDKDKGMTVSYEYPDSPLPDWIEWPVRRFVWADQRVIGARYSGLRYYLWHESRSFPEAKLIAATLRENVKPGETIFGDSTSTPLIALLAGVEITDNFVDTNTIRFRAGLPDVKSMIGQLGKAVDRGNDRLVWVLINLNRGIGGMREFREFFLNNFYVFSVVDSKIYGKFVLMKRQDRK